MLRDYFYKSLTDEEIFELIERDKHAEEEFYQRYKIRVKWLVRKYKVNNLEREDLIQEGMIGLFKAIGSFDRRKGYKFSTYANTCIRNQVMNALSAIWNQKKKMGSNEFIEELPSQTTPEADAIADELLQNIQASVSGLTALEKKVLELYLDQKSYGEIASLLEISTKKVDNVLMKIKSKMSGRLEKSQWDISTFVRDQRLRNVIHKSLHSG